MNQAATTPIALLMCGSFNPITRMHTKMLTIGSKYLYDNPQYKVSVAKGLISPVNDLYHVKRRNLISSSHRINMINLAIREEGFTNWVECSTWESEQKEWKTTINVLNYHRDLVKKLYGPTAQLWLVSGADLIESMAIPGLWADEDLENISANYKLLVIPRIGSDAVKFVASHTILSRHKQNIIIVDNFIPNDDSSTKARNFIKKDIYPTHLLHESVINYIKVNNLYKNVDA